MWGERQPWEHLRTKGLQCSGPPGEVGWGEVKIRMRMPHPAGGGGTATDGAPEARSHPTQAFSSLHAVQCTHPCQRSHAVRVALAD